jgi:hypothetical protein
MFLKTYEKMFLKTQIDMNMFVCLFTRGPQGPRG